MKEPNLSYIHKLSAGDTAFEEQMIAILKKEFPLEKERFETSISESDFKQTAEIVHKLKHKISILGLEEGYKLAVQYENDLKENNKTLTLEFIKVLNVITNYLNRI